MTPWSYKTGCTSQSCQNLLITSPWKLLLASEEVRSYVLSVMPTPRRGPTRLLFDGSKTSVNPDHARVTDLISIKLSTRLPATMMVTRHR